MVRIWTKTERMARRKAVCMDLYYNLLKYPVFSVDTIQQYYNSKESARTALKRR